MRKIFCDRCGNEIRNAYDRIIRSSDTIGMDLCKHCSNALDRFMGINTPGGGYEKLDSEVTEQ